MPIGDAAPDGRACDDCLVLNYLASFHSPCHVVEKFFLNLRRPHQFKKRLEESHSAG
ncbi:hypothetical protein GGTG_14421 [Gaeumannomyces tritici R3-111a-1]|uniref:Uncharacterized protein n=1 Tax=Gaeumannomyces tritici (strain R3-111a-1) TaxID=644352 RepID=J3PLF2_GAET3|nr:hypothetical protein GGTG_14421 [Gaeumannomyces tritici R3-111a-1]EJT68002.1 hypothetical protein GGTG_14421 [Gaeumannomyces tritici R3-111a-1]